MSKPPSASPAPSPASPPKTLHPGQLVQPIRITERSRPRQPLIRAKVGRDQHARFQLINERTHHVEREWEQHNLVLDQMLDLIAAHGAVLLNNYFVVGTSSAAPDPADTGLTAEIGRTSDNQAGTPGVRTWTYLGGGVFEIAVTRRIASSVVGGENCREWGFSPASGAGGNLAVRELFRNLSNDPITVTPNPDQALQVTYATRWTFDTSPTPLTIDVDGTPRDGDLYLYRGDISQLGGANDQSLLATFSSWTNGGIPGWAIGTASTLTFDSNTPSGSFTDTGSGMHGSMVGSIASYTPGDHKRTITGLVLPTGVVNGTGSDLRMFRRYATSGAAPGPLFRLDSPHEFDKDINHTVALPDFDLTAWA